MDPTPTHDLLVLTADKNMHFALLGIMSRWKSLGIYQITPTFLEHPEKDPGCLLRAHDFLRPFASSYKYALVVFDHDGCGKEISAREALEKEVEKRLSENGWENRVAVIVIEPELDVWVWSDSPHVCTVLGWGNSLDDLHQWLVEHGHAFLATKKPSEPKEALEKVLRHTRKPRSSSLYRQLAQQVSLEKCLDPAFLKLRERLQAWFGCE